VPVPWDVDLPTVIVAPAVQEASGTDGTTGPAIRHDTHALRPAVGTGRFGLAELIVTPAQHLPIRSQRTIVAAARCHTDQSQARLGGRGGRGET